MKLATTDLEIDVRAGALEDVPLLLSFMHSMAEFEKLEVTATEEILTDSLFGERPSAHTLIAFIDGRPVAYVIYFFNFATMVGKRVLHLEDLFVIPEFRRKGIARALMAYLADVAIQNQCGRFEWIVLDWNRSAIGFYQGLGATIFDDWRICRLEEEKIASVASGCQIG